MTSENNEVRCVGIRPAHDTDDFPVSQADKDLLNMTIHLMAWYAAGPAWKEVLCDVNGKMIVDPTAILENPPTEDEAGKAPTSEWAFDHDADAAAHHAKYTDGEAQNVADTQIGIHAALPTVHQDAPDLILTHKGDASAHHTKYTDAEARAVHSPISIAPPAFFPYRDGYDYLINVHNLKNRTSLTAQYFMAAVLFPPGVTVTKVSLYGNRNDAAAALELILYRCDNVEGLVQMANILADWSDGFGSKYDDSISVATIDNSLYSYVLQLQINPNDSIEDVRFTRAEIEFTG